jgi:hypothetical protein
VSGSTIPGRSGGVRASSLSSIDVQELVPLVTDVQLECLVSPYAPLTEASLVLQQRDSGSLSRVRTSENNEEEEEDEEGDHADTPCAIACVSTDWAGAGPPSSNDVETTTVAYDSRPGIIYANAFKPTLDSFVGLRFRARDGAVYISRIADDSLFRDCNFMVGDRVVAVNNISCIGEKKATPVVKLLHKTMTGGQQESSQDDPTSLEARTVSICVHNEQGDRRTVSTSVQKPNRFTPVGVSLVNKRGGRGSLQVTRIDPGSLFSDTLLLPHQRCLYINGMSCDYCSSQEAANVILNAPDRVTIISEPSYQQGSAAMVISASQQPTPQQEPRKLVRLHEKLWRNAKKIMPGRRPVSSSSSQRSIPRVTAC